MLRRSPSWIWGWKENREEGNDVKERADSREGREMEKEREGGKWREGREGREGKDDSWYLWDRRPRRRVHDSKLV